MTTPDIQERSLVRCLVADATTKRVLVMQRSANERFGAGMWEILQGSREHGETPDEAIVRELAEEIGIDATALPEYAVLLPVSTDHFAINHRAGHAEDWSNVNYMLIGHDLENKLGELVMDEDHDDLRWVMPDEAAFLLGNHDYSLGGQRLLAKLFTIGEQLRLMAAMLDGFTDLA